MYEGMRQMKAEGALTAIIAHEPPEENPASAGLYASVGFKQQYAIYDYRKKLK